MWDLIVSVPDHCLSFYFVKFCNQFNRYIVRFRPVLSNTDTNSTSKHLFSINEWCCLLATGVDMN